jgi:hypothetical protein
MVRSFKFMPIIAFAFLTCGAEAQVRIQTAYPGAAPASTNAALAYRRSACFQERISLLQEAPVQKFYLRLLTPPDCAAEPF